MKFITYFFRTRTISFLTGLMIGVIFCGAVVVVKDSITSSRWYITSQAKAAAAARIGNSVDGTVISINGMDMTVQPLARGSAKVANVVVHAASTTLVIIPGSQASVQRGTLASLSVGVQVSATGLKASNGSINARSIVLIIQHQAPPVVSREATSSKATATSTHVTSH